MADLLLEVGVEEMPPGAISPALDQLTEIITSMINGMPPASSAKRRGSLGVTGATVGVWGTPRRFILRITGMPERQPDQLLEVKGPPWSVAFTEEGKPTPAAFGFARKYGLTPADLNRMETVYGVYAAASTVVQGRTAIELASEIFPAAIRSLSFSKMMRWGDNSARFVRPIRWILAVCADDSAKNPTVIPLEVAGVRSGNQSRGHRFLSPEPFEIGADLDLVGALRSRFVLADPIERAEAIKAQGDRCASELGARILWDEDLLQEVTNLVEWPTAFIGSFDPEFLKLPRPVLITAMKKHQRFFPVAEKDATDNLLPKFLAVRNGNDHGLDIVCRGNERVLTSRFADARFFFERDCFLSADKLLGRLPNMLFQERLGTLEDKRRRLENLAQSVAEYMRLDPKTAEHLKRAAYLCKADLASEVVTELPALQGVMGGEYARRWGEPEEVAAAIEEHYLPRGAGGELPKSPVGKLLAVLDRYDTLVGYVGIGIQPRGSSDPFGLRRSAQAIVQITANEPGIPPITVFTKLAVSAYKQINRLEFMPVGKADDNFIRGLGGIIGQRMDSYLQESGVRYDLSDAVISAGITPMIPFEPVVQRALFLQEQLDTTRFEAIRMAAVRIYRILAPTGLALATTARVSPEDVPVDRPVDTQFIIKYLDKNNWYDPATLQLTEGAEQDLRRAIISISEPLINSMLTGNCEQSLQLLEQLVAPVNRLFDEVLIMADDAQVRDARLNLLLMTYLRFKLLADFPRLES